MLLLPCKFLIIFHLFSFSSRLFSVIQHAHFKVVILFFSLGHIADTLTQNVSDSLIHHLTERVVRLLIPAYMKYCHVLPLL